jgi:hypothetical protein
VGIVLVEDKALDCLLSSGLLNIVELSLDNLDKEPAALPVLSTIGSNKVGDISSRAWI